MAKIAIWMGHSGEEVGASGIMIEDNITRQAREWSVAYARACGHIVTTDNDNMSLSQRIFASDSSHAGILEWHANSGGGTGTEIWYSQYATGRAQEIATAMVALAPQFGFPNRGIHNSKTNRYGRLGILDTPKPLALLVETMFVDTQDDVNDWNENGKAMVEAMTATFLAGLGLKSSPSSQPSPSVPAPSKPNPGKTVAQIAQEVIDGKWGNDPQRSADLKKAGYDAEKVRAEVNRQLGATSKPKPSIPQITVDGQWGKATTKRLQQVLDLKIVDGVISHQYKSNANTHLYSAQFDKTLIGSNLIRAMQSRLGLKADGLCGADTIRALQRHYGTTVDGVISPVSNLVKAMQRALNQVKF